MRKKSGARLYVLILAGGASVRFGGYPKALKVISGRNFIEHILRTVSSVRKKARIMDVYLVTGRHHTLISSRISGLKVTVIHNRKWRQGQFSSIKAGIKKMPLNAGGVLIWPVDVPFVRPDTVIRLARAFNEGHFWAVLPSVKADGRLSAGHPALLSLTALIGAAAGNLRRLDLYLKKNGPKIKYVSVRDKNILKDIDTQEDLER